MFHYLIMRIFFWQNESSKSTKLYWRWRILVRSWWPGHGFSCDGGAMTLNHRPPSLAGVPQDSRSFLLPVPVPIPVSDDYRYLARNIVKTHVTIVTERRDERPPSLPRSWACHATRRGTRAVTSTLQNRWVISLWCFRESP